MEFPNISYIITSQLFDKTDKYELLIALPSKDKECDALVIVPEKNKEELNGSNIIFTKTSFTFDGKEYPFTELAIGLEDDKCYLIFEKSQKKIWYLPDEIISFLKMDITNNFLALTILEDKPYIINVDTKNTYGSKQNIKWTKEVILEKDVEFYLSKNDEEKETLNQSYFKKYKSTYKINECYLNKVDDKIGIYSDLKIDQQPNKNACCLIGYISLSS